MVKERLEGELTLAYSNGVPLEDIQKSLAIPFEEAIQRFLSKPTRNKIIAEGRYFLNPQDKNQKLINATFSMGIGGFHSYKKEFCRTEQGKLWYESHTPDLATIAVDAYCVTQKFSERIRLGQQRASTHRFVG